MDVPAGGFRGRVALDGAEVERLSGVLAQKPDPAGLSFVKRLRRRIDGDIRDGGTPPDMQALLDRMP